MTLLRRSAPPRLAAKVGDQDRDRPDASYPSSVITRDQVLLECAPANPQQPRDGHAPPRSTPDPHAVSVCSLAHSPDAPVSRQRTNGSDRSAAPAAHARPARLYTR
eukprot:1835429-Prymnesium_polylepis.1